MKVSTTYFFERSVGQMAGAQGRVSELQAKVSSGKQVVRPSDAPTEAAQIARLKGLVARQEAYLTGVDRVSDRLALEESALSAATDALIRMRELAMQAASDTQTPDTRRAIALEMRAMRDELGTLANTRTLDGSFIFSGSKSQSAPFAYNQSGEMVYQGNQAQRQVLLGDGQTLSVGQSGADVFVSPTRVGSDGEKFNVSFFQSIDDLIAGVSSSSHAAMSLGLTELDIIQTGISLATAKVGAETAELERYRERVEETKIRMQALLSSAEDLDYAEAIAQMNKEMLSLEAAQGSFARIAQLSLFNYLN